MSWTVIRSERSRHFVLRASAGEVIPDALIALFRDERIVAGWLRGSGMIEDVDLRAYDSELRGLGSARRFGGPVHLLALEGSIGVSEGEPSTTLHAVLARQTDRGLETVAGEIARARAIGLEVFVTSLDDAAFDRSFDEAAGVWLVRSAPGSEALPRPAAARPGTPPRSPAAPWFAAVDASDRSDRDPRVRPPAGPIMANAPMPARPARAGAVDVDGPLPETGDMVDHFAFGLCEVLKTDGDRIHLRVGKEGRVREIAMEMLRVSRLPDSAEGRRHFKLERRI